MIQKIAKRDLLVGDKIVNLPGEKTTMVVVDTWLRDNGDLVFLMHRINGRKIYGCTRPQDYEFQVER
jgi:hypothetical protein